MDNKKLVNTFDDSVVTSTPVQNSQTALVEPPKPTSRPVFDIATAAMPLTQERQAVISSLQESLAPETPKPAINAQPVFDDVTPKSPPEAASTLFQPVFTAAPEQAVASPSPTVATPALDFDIPSKPNEVLPNPAPVEDVQPAVPRFTPPPTSSIAASGAEPKKHGLRKFLLGLVLLLLIFGVYFVLNQAQKRATEARLASEAQIQAQLAALARETKTDKLSALDVIANNGQIVNLVVSKQTSLEGDLLVAATSEFTSPVTISVSDETALTVNGSSDFNGAVTADSIQGFFSGTASLSGTFSGIHTGSFSGGGSKLTGVDADKLDGNDSAYYLNASNFNAGTLSDARLSANVTLQDAANTFTGSNSFTQPVAGVTAVNSNEFVTLGQLTTVSAGNYFLQNGNSYGATAMLGTNDAFGLAFETSGSERVRIDTSGNVGIGTDTPGVKLHVYGTGNQFITTQRNAGKFASLGAGTSGGSLVFDETGDFFIFPGAAVDASSITDNKVLFMDGQTGNVGIGLTNPTYKLAAEFSDSTLQSDPALWNGLRIRNTDSTINTGAAIHLVSNVSGGAAAGIVALGTAADSSALQFYTEQAGVGRVIRQHITSTGNVGIGTTAPGSLLEIAKTGTGSSAAVANISSFANSASAGSYLLFSKSRGATVGSLVATGVADVFGVLDFRGVNSSSAVATGARILGSADGAPGVTEIPGRITFLTSDGVSAATERLRIDKDGKVGIGDTSPAALLTVGSGDLFQVASTGDLTSSNAGTWTFSNDTNFALTGGVNGLSFDGTTLSVDATNDRIGVGTAAPDTTLHVHRATAGTVTGSLPLVVENDTTSGLQILNPDNAYGAIYFGAPTSATAGRILYGGPTVATANDRNALITYTNNAEVMRVSSAGNVGIGDTSPAALLTVGSGDAFQINSSGAIAAATGITTSGNFLQTGAGTFGTGSGAVSLNGAVTTSSTLQVGSNIIMTAGTDIRPTANSTSALAIAQADGTDYVVFDSTNKRVRIGSASVPTSALSVTGDVNIAGQFAIGTAPSTLVTGMFTQVFTDTSGNPVVAVQGQPSVAATVSSNNQPVIGVRGRTVLNTANTQNWTATAGFRGFDSTFDFGNAPAAATTITGVTGLYVNNGSIHSTVTLTNQYGIYIERGNRASTNTYGAYIQQPGLQNGIGNTTDLIGLSIPAASNALSDQTATTTNAHSVSIGVQTYTSTTNTRTLTNAASVYIAGAPVAGSNVAITNGPYALWVDASNVRFDGDILTGAASTSNIGSTTAEFNSLYLSDNTGLNLGLDQDALLAYDEATDDRVELTGTGASLFIEDRLSLGTDSRTIADNGVGASAATLTLNPNSSYVKFTCNDADGCDITMDEAAPVKEGNILVAVNLSANVVNFTDTAGVTELAGNFACGQYDSITLIYDADRWVELARSNN